MGLALCKARVGHNVRQQQAADMTKLAAAADGEDGACMHQGVHESQLRGTFPNRLAYVLSEASQWTNHCVAVAMICNMYIISCS